jgi:protein-arginine kinase activator protein McsA
VLEEIYHWKGELKRAEEQEDYAKAALIHGKIKYLENKIKEL